MLWASVGAMMAIFAVDIFNSAEIQLHVLYVFPLTVIAYHSARRLPVAAAVALALALQVATFYVDGLPMVSKLTNSLVSLSASIMIVWLTRRLRRLVLAATQLAATDSLTGLLNRRSFDAALDSEIARQKRYGGNFSVVLIDLDNFKAVNDSLGHLAGDRALQLTAATLRAYLRESDCVARFGGDEFAVLMPCTAADDCSRTCQLLCERVSRAMAEEAFELTASIGYVVFDSPPESSMIVARSADQAMYLAKARGKDRVATLIH